MKPHFTFLFIFLFLLGFGQKYVIKIYVTDAENGKNISNAKVCLEGFEIPAIKAQYNKKEKYYYFTEIPKNYNTVMVYHKKYNEKGFQDINGLPKELKFKLNFRDNVYFNYDDLTNDSKVFYYIEDPYKIILRPKEKMDYGEFRNYLFTFIKENNLEIEVINPTLEYVKINNKDFEIDYNSEPYPFYYGKCYTYFVDTCPRDSRDKDKIGIFPTIFGMDLYTSGCNPKSGKFYTDMIAFFIRKKDKQKFKRFNDPFISKLSSGRFSLSFAIYPKNEDSIDRKISPKKYFQNRDNKINKFIKQKRIDISSYFFYNLDFSLDSKENFNFLFPTDSICKRAYFPIDKNKTDLFFLRKNLGYASSVERLLNITNDITANEKFPEMDIEPSLGLGILDQYEYHYSINVKK